MDRENIQRLFAFHHWATDRAFTALSSVSAADLDVLWGGSFGSGRKLLRHVVGVERLWCDRWNGHSARTIPDYPATHAGKDFRAEWERVKPDQRKFVIGLTTERLAGDLTYVNLKGETWKYPLADILFHCANHGTYHRGQITQLLRDRGRDARPTDFLDYIDEQGNH